MIAVIFEVLPAEDNYNRYLELAAELKPLLAEIEGFISIERFQSLSEPGKILSLSFWRDEDAVQQWRNRELHRSVQQQGRSAIFTDYRLRVASVIRDYGMFDREQAPQDSRKAHNGEADE
ncbi:Antibiotic biosynthesis monooxygenase [Cedecea lapagei]|uniref:Antibiotic biosynthesis monooxygenase n=1 Tax=Cedecea lapagei TaxID=158823 RepID=A0A3S4II66_9ENTR|nr:antibiotic biosynthesis monooxygenase [Cedecea lapagei]VEB97813.1 Antibiotic biosynthesis monooxygenase [Cedecea lapagei]